MRQVLSSFKYKFKYKFYLLITTVILVPQAVYAQDSEGATASAGIIESVFQRIIDALNLVFYFKIGGENGIPFIVLWLVAGAVFFTLRMKFINVRAFKHAIDIVRGKYDDPEDEGDVSHFQALAAALSGTVGIGNIAGVAIAIRLGGPGAAFWMTVAGFLGMSSKFAECTLGQKFRTIKPDGTVGGGPMYYLSRGLSSIGMRGFGKGLGVIYAVFCAIATMGAGNMFQANQAYAAVSNVVPFFENASWLFGLILVAIVGLVILGGIERIGAVAGFLVPFMAVIYALACVWVMLVRFTDIPGAIGTIISSAFVPQAVAGGLLGAIVIGFQRAVFSNEAGIGSAAIAHSAARTDEPVREGIVALLEPFIDTMFICNMTAMVIVLTGVYADPAAADLDGARLSAASFATIIGWFPYVIAIAGFLFAISTMISWSYYGQMAWSYLFGDATVNIYKALFLFCGFVGSIINLQLVLQFSDILLLAMSIPNLLGCFFLSGIVASELESYMNRLNSGEMIEAVMEAKERVLR
ncbi:amino acid carrier protein [Synechococcus sp. PCC 7335]|uniref:alanine/glycine:cation symporter family protein n=1 Tax=Synechococcus sp. (strain ATCC 29403 / PCC 7335) TaxID=91464 RepID=UPI00017EDCD7|nr:alanine/glycine:cation symporter family protein [Synechococcus sp. PCC 7335]EDX85409.1 amino acid carrier protein [Synechococcus sp. PCC 7335]